jgi:catechol 2,3-dioxygenase-like lactoylglutathione lyase family enzyme
MHPRLTVVTLGVADVARARAFYEALGHRVSTSSNEHIVFLDAGGVVLALYARAALAEDANMKTADPGAAKGAFGGFTLARNVGSRAEVDAAIEGAEAAGATVLKPAAEAFWGGYSGYYADLDGYPWEVAHNPYWSLDENGEVVLP